jgi:16S rRNA (guanine527-N7)-methyltransferase
VSDWAALTKVCDVSRETIDRLDAFLGLLRSWNKRINLVSPSSLDDAVGRHFADAAQLWRLKPADARVWLDLGSGAGFPGLVIAAVGSELDRQLRVRLVESDLRKAAFLRSAAQAMELDVAVLDVRIEDLEAQGADVVSARALAPLPTLLGYAEKHRAPRGIALFQKGRTVHKEIEAAARQWDFELRVHPSLTESEASILEIGAVKRV